MKIDCPKTKRKLKKDKIKNKIETGKLQNDITKILLPQTDELIQVRETCDPEFIIWKNFGFSD